MALARALRPVIFAINAFANALLKLLRVETKDEVAATFSDDELARLVRDAGEAGLLDDRAPERLHDALELGRRPVRDVVLPLERVVYARVGVTPEELERLSAESGFSRFPVVDERAADRRLPARQGRAGRRAAGCAVPGAATAADRPGPGGDTAGRRPDRDAAQPYPSGGRAGRGRAAGGPGHDGGRAAGAGRTAGVSGGPASGGPAWPRRRPGRPTAGYVHAVTISAAMQTNATYTSLVAVGDSFTEGMSDLLPDGSYRGWADLLAGPAGRPHARLPVRQPRGARQADRADRRRAGGRRRPRWAPM